MKAAKLDRSARLQRVHELLKTGREFSTMEIVLGANVMAVSAAVSELRAQGKLIHCQRRADVWYYRMEIRPMTRIEMMAKVGI
jgi:hypothetical protein